MISIANQVADFTAELETEPKQTNHCLPDSTLYLKY